MQSFNRHGIPLDDPRPTLRYDQRGDLYADFPAEIVEPPTFPLVRLMLTNDLAEGSFEWEPLGGTLWLRWDSVRLVEQRLRRMWPTAPVTAAANPGYGQRAAEIAGRR